MSLRYLDRVSIQVFEMELFSVDTTVVVEIILRQISHVEETTLLQHLRNLNFELSLNVNYDRNLWEINK